jgi:7-cyano-7-deazaguanine synthase in queuosine biosynthesis
VRERAHRQEVADDRQWTWSWWKMATRVEDQLHSGGCEDCEEKRAQA